MHLLYAGDHVLKTLIEHEFGAELPRQHGFEERTLHFLGTPRIIERNGLEALAYFDLQCLNVVVALGPGQRRLRRRRDTGLESQDAFGHLLSDQLHHLAQSTDGVQGHGALAPSGTGPGLSLLAFRFVAIFLVRRQQGMRGGL